MRIKQVIIMRKFPSLRTGKYIAQGAHASQIALKDAFENYRDYYDEYLKSKIFKIVVYVHTEGQLVAMWNNAKSKNLPTSIVEDAGFTEFKGVPTITAVAIGPAPEDLVDAITRGLPLF